MAAGRYAPGEYEAIEALLAIYGLSMARTSGFSVSPDEPGITATVAHRERNEWVAETRTFLPVRQ